MNTTSALQRKASGKIALMVGASVLASTPAFAQDLSKAPGTGASPVTASPKSAPPDAHAVGEVVVTALRRETSLQKTPIAITAVIATTLRNMGIEDSSQLARAAPGLVMVETANGGNRLVLRNIQAAGEPIVGLYYGETPVLNVVGLNNDAGESTPSIGLFDVKRVEVLRGPQGTLYGSSSMAGTVRLIFQDPKLDTYEGSVSERVSSVDHGDISNLTQAMVNVPIVKDLLAVRAVGFYHEGGGWVDDTALGKKNINDLTLGGGRLMVRFTPTENLTIDGLASIQDSKSNDSDWPFQPYAAGGKPYVNTFPALQPTEDRLQLYSASAQWNLGAVQLTANTSWQTRHYYYAVDISGIGQLVGLGPATANSSESDATQETQEFRISSGIPGPFKWTVGAFHSERNEYTNSLISAVDPASGDIIEPSTAALGNLFYLRDFDSRLKQTAGFVDASYTLFDKLTLSAGTRYYQYSQTTTSELPIGIPAAGIAVEPRGTATADNSGWLYKVNLSYQATPSILVYTEAADGFRPGGVNQVSNIPAAFSAYQPDSLWNYEVGVKSSWFHHALTANGDLFQIDWNGLQSTAETPDGFFNFVTNAGKVQVRGLEYELSARPMDGLLLQASGSHIIAKLMQDQITDGAIIVGAGTKGDFVPYTPKTTAQFSVQYNWGLRRGDLQALARADLNYTGESWTQFARTDPSADRLPGYANTSIRLAVSSPAGGWEAALVGSNLLDTVGLTSKATSTTFLSQVRATSIAPRTVGVEVRKDF